MRINKTTEEFCFEAKLDMKTNQEKLDEHDITKNMLNIIRGYKNTSLIKEGDDRADTISPQPNDSTYTDEVKKIMDAVDPRVRITNFKIYPTDRNVELDGVLLETSDEGSGIQFKMNFKEGELRTSMNNVDLTGDTNEILRKLNGYYTNWTKDWATKLNQDYKPKTN